MHRLIASVLLLLPLSAPGMFNPSFNNIHIKELEYWNLTLGPTLSYTAGSTLHGPGIGGGIALNKLGFSLQAEFTITRNEDGTVPYLDAASSSILHLGASFIFFEGGYSRMRLSSGLTANGWHLGLEIPLPLSRDENSLMRFLRVYYRPTWISFPGGREVFHEIGISLRFRIMLEE